MGEAKRKGPLAARQAAAVAESNRLEGEFRAFLREVTALEKRIALPMLATRHVAEKKSGQPDHPARLVLVRFDELSAWAKAHGVGAAEVVEEAPVPVPVPEPVPDQTPAAVRRALGFGGEGPSNG